MSLSLDILSEDKEILVYRKSLNKITNYNPISSILLMRILYWWDKTGSKPFCKYKLPPNNTSGGYTNGSSWCEELGITKCVFDTALSNIAHRRRELCKPSKEKPIAHLIEYYKNSENLTFYNIVDEEELFRIIQGSLV